MKLQAPRKSIIAASLYALFILICMICLWRYFAYLLAIVPFEYDWLPTDGDHLNFAHRLAQGLPIYLSMSDGQILSIYDPLYHALIAALGGKEATLSFARSLSMLFWLACPLLTYLYAYKKWGRNYAILAALFIFLPPRMLLDIVQVNADSLMALLFLSTLIYCERATADPSKSWFRWILLGIMAALCYLAKQQGMMAIAAVVTFVLVKERKVGNTLKVITGFLLTIVACTLYLESTNHGQFLNATIFDLNHIMQPSFSMAIERLVDFSVKSLGFTISAIVALYFVKKKQYQLTVWHVSFLLHIPFLLKILGNAGGGDVYFLTLWFTMVMTGLDIAYFTHMQKAPKHVSLNPLLILLCFNIVVTTISAHKHLNKSPVPDQETSRLMADYYQSVKLLVAEKGYVLALTNRDIGALVANQIRVENEGCTMFVYAWNNDPSFNHDAIINSIRRKKYDLITTGLSPYPADAMQAIQADYHLAFTKTANLNEGLLGPISVYVRNPG